MADPNGEAEVCVGNVDIIDIDGPMTSYWDGRFVKVGTDENKINEYNHHGVSSVTVKLKGDKIKLLLMDIEDVFINNPEANFTLEGEEQFSKDIRESWYDKVKEWRKEGRKTQQEFEETMLEAMQEIKERK